MSWYKPSPAQQTQALSTKATFSEMKKIDPKTHQIFTEYV